MERKNSYSKETNMYTNIIKNLAFNTYLNFTKQACKILPKISYYKFTLNHNDDYEQYLFLLLLL